ncbi:MAG: ABC transporter substrate-binding protein [Bacteroidia bacterium]|nr:ABC transporter substrate-binding protein [Bacteroidia bacterium]
MKFYNRLYFISVFFVFMLLFASCNSGTGSKKQVFHYNQPEGLATLDPAFAKSQPVIWATHQLYNSLVELDEQLHIKPSLAKSWKVSDDRLTYTFHLRSDVYFHDNDAFAVKKGRLMNAADAVYSFSRILDKSVASPGAWIFNGRVDTLLPFKAIDDTTFSFKLLQPFPPILGILSMQYCSIVPKEVVEKYGKDFRNHPCGTGPFRFKEWEEGQALILLKNENYFEKDSSGKRLPYLDAVKVSFLDSKATEFLEFQQGMLNFINDIDATFKDEVLNKRGELKKEWEDKIVLNTHPYLNTEYLGILVDTNNVLVKNSPLRLQKIRQAVNYGFNRRKMMMYLRNSIGTAAEAGFIPTGMPGYDSTVVKGYYYNHAKARALLAEAGFPDGNGLPEIKLLTIPIYADLASFIAKELEDIGIKVKVETVQRRLLLEQTAKSEALFFRASWIADYPDAENYLSVFYGKNPAPPNYTRYNNKAFDELYDMALRELNDSIRYTLYQKMDQMVIKDAPVIPLWYDKAIHLVNKKVSGFYPNALNLLELRRTKLKIFLKNFSSLTFTGLQLL